jgi:hypothetical protein
VFSEHGTEHLVPIKVGAMFDRAEQLQHSRERFCQMELVFKILLSDVMFIRL